MKYIQFSPDGTIRGTTPADGFDPPDCDYLFVRDDEVPDDLHTHSVQNGRLVLRPQAEIDTVLAERARGSLFERAVKAEVDKRMKDVDARLAALEGKPSK